jgi:hypothetical protein
MLVGRTSLLSWGMSVWFGGWTPCSGRVRVHGRDLGFRLSGHRIHFWVRVVSLILDGQDSAFGWSG